MSYKNLLLYMIENSNRLLNKKKESTNFFLLVYFVYAFWLCVFKYTKFYTKLFGILCLMLLVFAVFQFFYKSKVTKVSKVSLIWLPYLLVTAVSLPLNGHFSIEPIVLSLLLAALVFAKCKRICSNQSKKIIRTILIVFGIIAILGLFIQIVIPSFYYSNIGSLITNTSVEQKISRSDRGYIGFTGSQGQNAQILVFASAAVFCLSDNQKKITNILLFLLFAIGVFLCGERSSDLIVLICPLLLVVLSQKKLEKTFLTIICILMVTIAFATIFFNNLDFFENVYLFKNIVTSIKDYLKGEDITSGRTELFKMAIEQFEKKPFFGIGINNFMNATGAYTQVHNAYLQVLCEQGIFGLILFLLPLFYFLFYTIRNIRLGVKSNSKKLLLFSLYCQIYFIFMGLFSNTTMDTVPLLLYFLGVLISANYRSSQVEGFISYGNV